LEALLSSGLSAVGFGFNDSTTWQHWSCLVHWSTALDVLLVRDLDFIDSIAVGFNALVAVLDSGATTRCSVGFTLTTQPQFEST